MWGSTGVGAVAGPAEQLAVCARASATEAGTDAECFRLVLAACLPPGEELLSDSEREQCFQDAQAQLAALKEYQENPPPSPKTSSRLSPLGVWLTVAGTAGFFALVGRRISRRVNARNSDAFEAQLGEIEAAGFERCEPPEIPGLRSLPEFNTVRARARHSDDTTLWVLELEHAKGAENERWPARAAAWKLDIGDANGVIRARSRKPNAGPGTRPDDYLKHNVRPASIGDLLLPIVAAELVRYWPELALELRDGWAVVLTVPEPLGGDEPLQLLTLAQVAESLRSAIRDAPSMPVS